MAFRMSWAAVCFGNPFLPLPIDGKAMDFSFLSSARARQFFTVFSRSSSHLSAPQTGLLQWITNLAGRPWPALTAAPATSKGPFFFRSSRTASTNSLPPFFSSVLPRQGQGRVRMPPRLRHRHSTSHVIAYFKWPEQLHFHKTAKQDLCLGWSGRDPGEDLPSSSGH